MPAPTETIRLPSTVYDDSVGSLIVQLIEAEKRDDGPLLLDFQDMRFYVPVALTFLLGTVSRWKARGRQVKFCHLDSCSCLNYLERIGFFTLCDVPLPEKHRRHDTLGRFVPLYRADASLRGSVDKFCTELAGWAFPELMASDDPEAAGPFDMLEYAASELINNVIQHAKGTGYVAAQVYPKSGFIRLAVADVGMGIRGSFEESQPEF